VITSKKNEPPDNSKINRFINNYNHTIHKKTGVSPIQMQNNKELEVNYSVDNNANATNGCTHVSKEIAFQCYDIETPCYYPTAVGNTDPKILG
jgi:hypothetical protein